MRGHLNRIRTKCGSLLRRFRRDARGNVAIITGLAAVPLIVAAGVAVDVARSSRSQNALQVAVDAAALAVAASDRVDMAGLTDAQKAARREELKEMAKKFIKASYRDEGAELAVDVNITDEIVAVEGTKPYPTTLMNLVGIRSVDLGARAEVNLQGGIAENIEIALVMDTTGSMEGNNKLRDAKAAALKLLETVLGDAASDDKIKLTLVPFAGSVNVGAGNLNSGWIDTTGKATVSKVNFTDPTYHNMKGWDDLRYRNAQGQTVKLPWNGCVEARLGDLAVNDTPPTAATPNTLFTPYFAPDEPESFGQNRNDYVYYETGSETQRIKNQAKYASKVITVSSATDGPWYNCAASSIVPLTTGRADIETGIAAMEARGSTNLVEGFMWGWRVLSPDLPYTEGKAFTDKEWRKVVVFMTDGENDVGTNGPGAFPPATIGTRYTAFGYGSTTLAKNRFGTTSQSQARAKLDEKFLKACTDLKAKAQLRESPKDRSKKIPSVEVYTIAFQAPDAVKENLRLCATSPSYYVEAKDGAALLRIFDDIGKRLKTMYLSK